MTAGDTLLWPFAKTSIAFRMASPALTLWAGPRSVESLGTLILAMQGWKDRMGKRGESWMRLTGGLLDPGRSQSRQALQLQW
jgi:hypothetical protein